MMDISTIALATGKKLVFGYLQKRGDSYIKNFFGNVTKFEQELSGVINESLTQYQSVHKINEKDNRIAFYISQAFVEELLHFSFFNEFDVNALQRLLLDKQHIIPPTIEELNDFFDLFRSNLSKHKNLKKLEIEFTYKDKIFQIYEQLNQLTSSLSRTVLQIDDSLKGEYIRQLKEIKDDIKSFKHKTALRRLESLEASIKDNGKMTDEIQCKVYFLKGLCWEDLDDEANTQKDYYIKAYKYNKGDLDYTLRAAIEYLNNGDIDKSNELATIIIDKDDYNPNAWFIKFKLTEGDFLHKISTIPKKVLEDKVFIILIYHLYISLKDFDVVFKLQNEYLKDNIVMPLIPDNLSYQNKHYWSLIAAINLNLYHQENSSHPFDFDDEVLNNKRVQYLKELLKIFEATFRESEIKEKYKLYFYYNSYFTALSDSSSDLYELERDFSVLKNPVVGNIMCLIQILIQKNELDKALYYISSFSPTETENNSGLKELISCILHKIKGNKDLALINLKGYVDCFNIIDATVLFNLLNNVEDVFIKIEDVSSFKKYISNSKQFSNLYLSQIFDFFINALLGEDGECNSRFNQILSIKENTIKPAKSFDFFIARALYKYRLLGECISFLKSYVNTTVPSKDLYLYIWCLIEYKEADKVELIKILKWWRINVSLKIDFLKTEIYYRQYIEDWTEIEKIAELGYKIFPNNKEFLSLLLLALNRQDKKQLLHELSNTVKGVLFDNEFDAINSSNIYAQSGLFEIALDILYKCASKNENKRARQAFISNTTHFPETLFEDFPEVVSGSFVLYEIEGIERIIEINKKESNSILVDSFLGKKVNDEVFLKESIGFSFKKAIIKKVMNKYSALFNIIIREAENPTSDLQLKKFSLEGDNFKDFEKQLIEAFGAQGSMMEQFINEQLKSYYNGTLSFTEITASVFKGNFIDAYNFFTSANSSEGFITLPATFNINHEVSTNGKYILDASSIILFSKVFTELNIKYSEKFYVSPFVIDYFKSQIVEVRLAKEAKLSLKITVEGVQPQFYPDNYNEKRLEHLNDILNWINNYCLPLIIDKRVSFHSFLAREKGDNEVLKSLVDSLVGLEDEYYLITSDFFCVRNFAQFTKRILSPQSFISNLAPEKIESISEFLLTQRYIGISLNEKLVFEEFKKNKKGQTNFYSYALLNLNPYFNPSPEVFGVTIRLIKLLYLNSLSTDEELGITIQRILLSMLSGIIHNEKLIRLIRIIIYREFNLMGTALFIVMNEYERAVEILKGN
ncbi:hypothetical protein OCK74_21850 [Chitinophagaceae bacterium LB-8]|uniref:Uncharacterized protein n=1 Tax=Paraflavisolibacter caeni TaxID=2982496 RepID=A0A9X3B983_9BACT|nr:hypothetical protein [Paraflavisolibacter caeni]MCU7551780.1 hypothetical protein [Paraflavisolibacter caeni]